MNPTDSSESIEASLPQEYQEEEIVFFEGEETPSLNQESSDESETPEDSSAEEIMSKKVTIGGVEMEIEDAPAIVDMTEAPLFKRSDRTSISPEKLNELFEQIASGCKQKYSLLSMSLQGTEQLEEVYNLENMI